MINGKMATAGDYVDFSAADRAKLIGVNASAAADGSDVKIITSRSCNLCSIRCNTWWRNRSLLGWSIWMYWYGYPKRCWNSKEQRTKENRIQLSCLDFVWN